MQRTTTIFSRLFAILFLASACDAKPPAGKPVDATKNETVTLTDGLHTVRIGTVPFTLELSGPDGETLTLAKNSPDLIERKITFRDPKIEQLKGFEGFDSSVRTDVSRVSVRNARLVSHDDARVALVLQDPSTDKEEMRFAVSLKDGLIKIDLSERQTSSHVERNAANIEFVVRDGERFIGLGQRESSIDHRGKVLYDWTEEGGIGLSEATPPGLGNPFPNGEGMTHLPVPFFISSEGYGLWLDTTYRSSFAFDAYGNRTLIIDADEPRLGITVAMSRDPKRVIAAFTKETGRAKLPAPWVFGPRKRVDPTDVIGEVPEIDAIRAAGVAMTSIDDATHVLPHASQVGREDELRAWTARLHQLGYKPIAYLNPHVSVERPAAATYLKRGRQQHAFVRKADGSEAHTKVISGGSQEVVTIDFTSDAGKKFFESIMAETLDLGYDGWMLDFGEYITPDDRFADGRDGAEVHNDFPLLVQETTRDYLDNVRRNDYLFYVRSGYTGTSGIVPMVWSGDPSASFSDSRGLPAQVRSGISAGLSGIPFWGSDGTGFTCLTDPPPDKDVYLRWMAFAALSPDMHEEDACAQRPEGTRKWTMWDDPETLADYAQFSGLHTRLFPYIYAAAREATESGMPIMRHALLMHPDLPAAWEPQEEYYFGPSLYVAPVVKRGATMRELWLPPGEWFDWYTLTYSRGDAHITRAAPLNEIPLWLKAGGIVPMLDAEVMTLASTDDPSVVDMSDRDDVLDVRVAVTTSTPSAEMTLVNGTHLAASRIPDAEFSIPEGFEWTTDEAMLKDCERCVTASFYGDGTYRVQATFRAGTDVSFGYVTLGAQREHRPLRVRWDALIR